MVSLESQRTAAALVRHVIAQDAGSAGRLLAGAVDEPPTGRMGELVWGLIAFADRLVKDMADQLNVPPVTVADGYIRIYAGQDGAPDAGDGTGD